MSITGSILVPSPFLGCDSTSSFYGRSKISTWKLVSNDKTALETFVCLSENFELHESIQENLELVTCMLYGAKDTTSVNKARYDMFRMGKFSDAALPPNKVSYNTFSEQATRLQYGKEQQQQ